MNSLHWRRILCLGPCGIMQTLPSRTIQSRVHSSYLSLVQNFLLKWVVILKCCLPKPRLFFQKNLFWLIFNKNVTEFQNQSCLCLMNCQENLVLLGLRFRPSLPSVVPEQCWYPQSFNPIGSRLPGDIGCPWLWGYGTTPVCDMTATFES